MLPGRSLPPINPEWRDASVLPEQFMAIAEDLGGKKNEYSEPLEHLGSCTNFYGFS
jgi:hypothetical protein